MYSVSAETEIGVESVWFEIVVIRIFPSHMGRFAKQQFRTRLFLSLFIRPSSDGTYFGMVMSVRPGLRQSQLSALFSYMLWHIAEILHATFFLWTFDQVRMSSVSVSCLGVMPLLELKILEIHSFPQFLRYALTYWAFRTLLLHALTYCWNFACHFLLMNIRSSSSVVSFRQFFRSYAPFGT